jgi:Ca2+/Na+ antiporter
MGNQTDGVFCLQARSPYLTALTFFQGIVWMHLCADELVGLFQAAGRAAGVRESLLGATFMSWGASAGDLGGTLAVARRGSTRMAVTVSPSLFLMYGQFE